MNHGYTPRQAIDGSDMHIAVVSTSWNRPITEALADSASRTLAEAGASFEEFIVPGAVELTYAAQRLVDSERFDAVIVFGCVIKGDTPHFDYVCSSVTQGITSLNADGPVPVIFGVLTVLNERQAFDRCGGPAGDKGAEAARTALEMVAFARSIDE